MDIDRNLESGLTSLLQASFPGYPKRSHFKLPPHFRYVATVGDELAAQMGVELRIIRVGDATVRTFGVVDLCVAATHRSRGLAGRLLDALTADARARGIDFMLLFADDDRLYVRHGWAHVSNVCTWVKINEHRTLGLAERESLGDAMMVKATGTRAWPDGDVDLLGHVF
ncbi:MAG TPA: GNAT family N-acetyltransferase [Gaiellaceae bacterium]|jgi:GNAT superfamily N-acetyltransferase